MTPEQLVIAKEAVMDAARDGRLIPCMLTDYRPEGPPRGCAMGQIALRLDESCPRENFAIRSVIDQFHWWKGEEPRHPSAEEYRAKSYWARIVDTNNAGLLEGRSQFEVAVDVCKILDEAFGGEA